MPLNRGYIYIRSNLWWNTMNIYKMGRTSNIPDRDSLYATGEFERGHFDAVFALFSMSDIHVEKLLQSKFKHLNVRNTGGIEFYQHCIIDLIEPFFIEQGIIYVKLTSREIEILIRTRRLQKITNKINIKDFIQVLTCGPIPIYTPREDQQPIIDKAIEHFDDKEKGLLVLMCGVGKTLISLWIGQALNTGSILIGVPNILLLDQWRIEISKIFGDIPVLCVCTGVAISRIREFLGHQTNKYIVITTYASSCKVLSATNAIKHQFDMKILDEVHHLTTRNMKSSEDAKKYVKILSIKSVKQLSLTATLKQLNAVNCSAETIVSNDDIEYFGDIIERKTLLWAIQHNIITDYVIQTIVTNDDHFESILSLIRINISDDTERRLVFSVFAALKSIVCRCSNHLLIYCNNKRHSSKIVNYIKYFLDSKDFDIPDLYYSKYNSEMKSKDQSDVIEQFDNSRVGIITCVYCLGEGWDFPLLDGIVFAENMTSDIRIVQSALRANRKNPSSPDKISKIILPVMRRGDLNGDTDSQDFKKVRDVIYHLGLEDETIAQKIKVLSVEIKKHTNIHSGKNRYGEVEIGRYESELTEQLRLKTTKRTCLGITYEKARTIIAGKNITTKNEYYELCAVDNRLTEEPEIDFKGQFTNWVAYLGIERKYYDLKTCKEKVQKYLHENPDIKPSKLDLSTTCSQLCELDMMFPPNTMWVDYYRVNELGDIISYSSIKKKKQFSGLF